MMERRMPEVMRARVFMGVVGAIGLLAAVAVGEWKVGIGFGTGIAAMAGALEIARLKAASLRARQNDNLVRVLHGALQVGKYLVGIFVFWTVLNVVGSPLWSVCTGVTGGVACLVAAFAKGSARSPVSPGTK